MELQLGLSATPFNLDRTLSCGQTFRWEKKRGGWWYGVVRGNVVKTRQLKDRLVFSTYPESLGEAFLERYFGLDDDLPSILSSIDKDDVVGRAIRRFYGLRIARQDPWECVISYICATNSSIRMIKRMVFNLAKRFGRGISFEGEWFYTFPEPAALARVVVSELLPCGLGYRASYIAASAKAVASGRVSLDELASLDYKAARERLLEGPLGRKLLPGVGPKVADCVLLFSLGKMEAFPIDVWIERAVVRFYPYLFEKSFIERVGEKIRRGEPIITSEYDRISGTMRSYFGRYAGYAQEYLYAWVRVKPRRKSKMPWL